MAGSLLSSNELTVHGGPAQGKAIVGIATKAGQVPADGVAVGDTVDVILTGSLTTLTGGSSDGSIATSPSSAVGAVEIGAVLAANATVTAVDNAAQPSAGTIVVSVLVTSAVAPLVASASAAGQAALVLIGSSS